MHLKTHGHLHVQYHEWHDCYTVNVNKIFGPYLLFLETIPILVIHEAIHV